MFDGGTITIEGLPLTVSRDEAWMELHAALQGIGVKRAKLDARELELLLEAEETRLFRRLGHPTMAAYMVAELECSRHTANEKLRVAHELIDLPEIARRFRAGALSWTKVRELTRVATAETEDDWLEAICGVDGSQVQQMVKGFAKGARPTDRRDPDLIEELIGLRVPPVIHALWRQMRGAMDGEAGRRLSDAELAEQLCKRALLPATEDGHTRPLFQIAVTTCRVCKCAEQVGPGVVNAISAAAFERALCDAVFVGDLEDERPGRAQWSIPAPTRRVVAIRDRFCCTYPGCTSKRFLEAHHIVPRALGGTNAASGLTLLCDSHHKDLHDRVIRISGRAPDELVFERLARRTSDDEPPRYECVGPRGD